MADEIFEKRLRELALRTARRGQTSFTHFLDLSQIQTAFSVSRSEGVSLMLEGGYADAERRMGAFVADEPPQAWEWPMRTVEITWRAQFGSPEHRDLLGALMALGFERERMGDIVLADERAYVFAEPDMAEYIAASLTSAGRATVKCRLTDEAPDIPPPSGRSFRDTVPSLRLDAVLAAGFSVSRSDAAEYISRGRAYVNQALQMKSDLTVQEGDIISVRGEGRIRVEAVDGQTRKGRLAIRLFRYGG